MICGQLKIFWILPNSGNGDVDGRKKAQWVGRTFLAFVPLSPWVGPTGTPEDADSLEFHSPDHPETSFIIQASLYFILRKLWRDTSISCVLN